MMVERFRFSPVRSVDRELERSIGEIWEVASGFGLDPFPTHFEIVPPTIMYEFGSYGLPGRFSHWTHGKAYQRMKTMYDYGLARMYELAINSNPTQAFLLEGNSLIQNKLVIAHVLAHSDFFKHNAYFAPTHRQMAEIARTHADRIAKYAFEHGDRKVERFLDAVLSIQANIDPHAFIKPRDSGEDIQHRERDRRRATPYDDLFALEERGKEKREEEQKAKKIPGEPTQDLLGFLMEYANDLEDWQKDTIAIVREEQRYFLPQLQTKIINEGWASYWHGRIMRDLELSHAEYEEFAREQAKLLTPSPFTINPYFVGMKMLEAIEKRWEHPSDEDREKLALRGGQGMEKLFEVRELENDVSFIRNYLTKEVVEELKLYIYREQGGQLVVVEKDWEKIRNLFVRRLISQGIPVITVDNGDFGGNRELYLVHQYEGEELDVSYAERTLEQVHFLWGRVVHLETVVADKRTIFRYDGRQHTRSLI